MTTSVKDKNVLTAQDRCDKCPAAAKVIAYFLNGALMFCGHHATELSDSLVDVAVNFYDPEGII